PPAPPTRRRLRPAQSPHLHRPPGENSLRPFTSHTEPCCPHEHCPPQNDNQPKNHHQNQHQTDQPNDQPKHETDQHSAAVTVLDSPLPLNVIFVQQHFLCVGVPCHTE